MAKTLRIGFAMGGGVSLGTFNGAALTQVLKLAILRGNFDDVQVDCFSGASAGAMSLAVMLRSLVHQTPAQIANARTNLENEFGEEFSALGEDSKKLRDLIAAQVAQDIQEDVWVNDINIEALLKDGVSPEQSIKHTAGLLNRAAIEKIARDRIKFEGDTLDLSDKKILADRVLFGCALNNLTPILVDARREYTGEDIFLQALSDGMTSKTHREMRVFDLMFGHVTLTSLDDSHEHPRCWYRYREGVQKKGKTSDLRTRKAWSTIAATALASGAFPGAFEPVVLHRHNFEFGYIDKKSTGLWPMELVGEKSHAFTYSDGGALNNEPIRDCFRMASFLDAKMKKPGENVTRWIVFVDPNVAEPSTPLQVAMHRCWRLDDPNYLGTFDGWSLDRLTSLDRLVPFLGSLLGTVLNEARTIEGDKIFKTHKLFALRDGTRKILQSTLSNEPTTASLDALRKFIIDQLDSNRTNMLIPVGGLSLKAELERVIAEESSADGLGLLSGKVDDFCNNPGSSPHQDLWLRALAFVAIDLVMDMTGKSENTKLIAIAPEEPLPGGIFSGFGGFMSKEPGRFEVSAARYQAQQMLEKGGCITPASVAPDKPEFTDSQLHTYKNDFTSRIPIIVKRIDNLVNDSHLPLLPLLPNVFVRHFVTKALQRAVEKSFERDCILEIKFEFRLCMAKDFEGLELDGKGIRDRDIKPVHINGADTLITFATFNEYKARSFKWTCVHGNKEGTALRVDKNGLIDSVFCHVSFPTERQLKRACLMPNPIFSVTLNPEHQGTTLPASVWEAGLSNGVESLEDTLFS